MDKLNLVTLNEGVFIDGVRLNGITSFKVDSSMDNVTEFQVTFYGIMDGLDNIKPESAYTFKKVKPPYKPHRKYH